MNHATDHFQPPKTPRLGIIGLGYVGLPLALEFARQYETIGFDIRVERVAELKQGHDRTREVRASDLRRVKRLTFTCDESAMESCDVLIVTVPTPVNSHKVPDFAPLHGASKSVGRRIRSGGLVIFESTVYPGATEEVCVPIIEETSGMIFNRDFFAGYSPERINPGDKSHRLPDIVKVTSGSTAATAQFVNTLYASIVTAGTHPVSSIRIAEAAKVIENTQRDVNIALINELAMLFNRLGIDTHEILEAASTKWNFLNFRPGLVGGHCIGVDPYYLTHKAKQIGHHPEIILAGRRINDNMGQHVASEVLKLMANRGCYRSGGKVLVLGLTFKENCPDIRNTRVVDLVAALRAYNLNVDIHDPWVDPAEAQMEFGVELISEPDQGTYDAIVLAVAHDKFADLGPEAIRGWGHKNAVFYDIKHVFDLDMVDGRL